MNKSAENQQKISKQKGIRMRNYIENKVFKIAANILFRHIIKFNKRWNKKTDTMNGIYACDIDGQPYVMNYTLKKITATELNVEELESISKSRKMSI